MSWTRRTWAGTRRWALGGGGGWGESASLELQGNAPEVWDRVALRLAQEGEARAGGLREHRVLGRGGDVGRRAAHRLCKGARCSSRLT